jgi:hypothetical protein
MSKTDLKHLRQTIAVELLYYRLFPSDWLAQRISSLFALYSFESKRNVTTTIFALHHPNNLPFYNSVKTPSGEWVEVI